MPSQADILKSYLISLGFQIDNEGFNKLKQSLDNLTKLAAEQAAGMAKAYILAAGEIATALLTVTGATAALLDKIAQADLGYQKYALRMYLAVDAAKQLKIVTDAMGESLEDIQWNEELRDRATRLMGEARGMEPPKSAKETLRYVRGIREEFTRLKIEVVYGMEHVGLYIFKYLQGPIVGSKLGLKEFNDYIQQHLPEIAQIIAEKMAIVIKVFTDMGRIIKDAVTEIGKLWDLLTDEAKATLVVAVFGVLLAKSGPLGKLLLLVAALQEFYMFLRNEEGRDKRIDPYWLTLVYIFGGLYTVLGGMIERLTYFVNMVAQVSTGKVGSALKLAKEWPSFYKKSMQKEEDDFGAMMRGAEGMVFGDDEQAKSEWQKKVGLDKKLRRKSSVATEYDAMVEKFAKQYGVPADFAKAIMMVESHGIADLTSPTGVKGLFQVTERTGKPYLLPGEKWDPFNPEQSARIGIAHLADLLKRTKGDQTGAARLYGDQNQPGYAALVMNALKEIQNPTVSTEPPTTAPAPIYPSKQPAVQEPKKKSLSIPKAEGIIGDVLFDIGKSLIPDMLKNWNWGWNPMSSDTKKNKEISMGDINVTVTGLEGLSSSQAAREIAIAVRGAVRDELNFQVAGDLEEYRA